MRSISVAAIVLISTAVFGLLFGFWDSSSTVGVGVGDSDGEMIKSVTYGSRRSPDLATLVSLSEIGTTHITLIPFAFQRGIDDPNLRFNPDADWFSESDKGIRWLAGVADSLGMGVILKPHIWIGGYSTEGQTRDKIMFDSASDWEQWESNYRAFMRHHTELATSIGADVLVIGTELASVAREREAFFRALIGETRQTFDGKITYAANWWEDYEKVAFWDALDYIGVQAYFPISDEPDPSVEVLVAGWKRHQEALLGVSRRFERPVLFTEIGYRSSDIAASEPWRWVQRGDSQTSEPAYELQSRLYEAFFRTMWQESWFSGAILWRWHSANEGNRRGQRAVDFTPQDKPAEQVIARWFTRDTPGASSEAR